MVLDTGDDARMEIAHVLFVDIVGYSKLLTNEQRDLLQQLNQVVRGTDSFRAAEAAGKLVRLPTGDGMALVFFGGPEEPVRCATEIAKELRVRSQLRLRMGIHSGPVDRVTDVNDGNNIAGAGINVAQRVMDCGDAGHILLSRRIADDLAQYGRWRAHLHDIGEAEAKQRHSPEAGQFLQRRGRQSCAARETKTRRAGPRRSPLPHPEKNRAPHCNRDRNRGGRRFFLLQRASARKPEKSIAVLPFENLSPEKENAYFAGGIQDEVLTNLAKIGDLKVISRSSVMAYASNRPSRSFTASMMKPSKSWQRLRSKSSREACRGGIIQNHFCARRSTG